MSKNDVVVTYIGGPTALLELCDCGKRRQRRCPSFWTLALELTRASVRQPQSRPGAQLGERDDLAGVHREVLHGMEHRPENGDLSVV
jgi:hypothetical protein